MKTRFPRAAAQRPGDNQPLSLTDKALEQSLQAGWLAKRTNKDGGVAWGAKNKLAVHVPTGVPVDLFAATAENWFNYLVCRTGPGESNIRIAAAAKTRGWKWTPYGAGFARPMGLGEAIHPVESEREVFEFVGLEYREPWER